MNVVQGYCRLWSEKGFGFIKGNDGQDYFCHWSSLLMDGFKKLEVGQAVEFNAEDSEKGLKAVNVTVLK